MAVTKLSNSGIKTGVLKYDSMLAGNAAFDPAATWLIERVNMTGSTGTLTFSNIPQTYKHLQIRWIAGSPSSLNYLRFNGVSTTSYAAHRLSYNQSTLTAAASTSSNNLNVWSSSTSGAPASYVGAAIIDIHDYASTSKNKTVRYHTGYDANTAGYAGEIAAGSGLFISTDAITSLTITASSGSFNSGSTFALYGMVG